MRVSTCAFCDGIHTACMYICAVLISSASFSIVWADPCQIHAYSGG